jgi:hypothetical protein
MYWRLNSFHSLIESTVYKIQYPNEIAVIQLSVGGFSSMSGETREPRLGLSAISTSAGVAPLSRREGFDVKHPVAAAIACRLDVPEIAGGEAAHNHVSIHA